VDSWCGKCKLILAHTIEAMVGDTPARVCCNTCKSQHGYKAQPPGARGKRSNSGSDAPAKTGTTAKSRRNLSFLQAKSAETARRYSPKETYQVGEVLEHPMFGRGIATSVRDGTKVVVLFENGAKTLVCGQ
jgi:hypothetical protein